MVENTVVADDSFRKVDEHGKPLFDYEISYVNKTRTGTVVAPDRATLQWALREEAKNLPRIDELLCVRLSCGCVAKYGDDRVAPIEAWLPEGESDHCKHGNTFVRYGNVDQHLDGDLEPM